MEAEHARLRALIMNVMRKPGSAPIKAMDLMTHASQASGDGIATLDEVLAELGVKKGK